MAAKNLWKVQDIADYLNVSVHWVYRRVAPNTPYMPKIPRIKNIPRPRFDPEVVKALYPTASTYSSVTTEKNEIEKSDLLEAKPKIREKEKLW